MLEKEEYERPMKCIESLCEKVHGHLLTSIDKDYNIVVFIYEFDRIKNKKYLYNLEGRGETYREACIDYIRNIMDSKFNLRYLKKYYATLSLREFIKQDPELKKYYERSRKTDAVD